MATANSTRRLAGSSLSARSERVAEDPSALSDEFGALLRRLLVSVNHVMLVSQHFGDLADLPPEHAPAGITLHVAAQDLDVLYSEIDSWHVRHEHAPKPAGALGVGVFTEDDSARTPLASLPPAVPCPFCGRHDDIMVSQTNDAGSKGEWFRASCGICGADAPGGETPLKAAEGWNTRGEL